MLRVFRKQEVAALAPLINLARGKSDAERSEWMEDLRREAPILMARIEALLAEPPH
jgi:hypothetical protein